MIVVVKGNRRSQGYSRLSLKDCSDGSEQTAAKNKRLVLLLPVLLRFINLIFFFIAYMCDKWISLHTCLKCFFYTSTSILES